MFITFEGPDGAGKSTHIRAVKEFLEERGRKVVLTREPGGTTLAEQIRELLLVKSAEAMDDKTELLLYLAARAQHVSQKILPAIEAGCDVICDRFSDSSVAYQGYGRGINLGLLKQMNDWACQGLVPDYTFVMLLKPADALARLKKDGRELDRMELEDIAFKERVYNGFLACAEARPGRVVTLDASDAIETNRAKILEFLEGWLEMEKR